MIGWPESPDPAEVAHACGVSLQKAFRGDGLPDLSKEPGLSVCRIPALEQYQAAAAFTATPSAEWKGHLPAGTASRSMRLAIDSPSGNPRLHLAPLVMHSFAQLLQSCVDTVCCRTWSFLMVASPTAPIALETCNRSPSMGSAPPHVPPLALVVVTAMAGSCLAATFASKMVKINQIYGGCTWVRRSSPLPLPPLLNSLPLFILAMSMTADSLLRSFHCGPHIAWP